MKRLNRFIIICFITLILAGCSASEDTNKISIPASSKELKGDNIEDVISLLKNAGFTNISTVVKEDLITGWVTKDGEVEAVEVVGDTSFDSGSEYPAEVSIVITYHTFPADKAENETVTPDTEVVEPSSESKTNQKNGFDESTNQIVTMATFDFQVPSYWKEANNKEGFYQANGENDNIKLFIMSVTDDQDTVSFEMLAEENEKKATIEAFLASFEKGECTDSATFEANEVKGILYKFTYTNNGIDGSGAMLCYPSIEDNKWFYISYIQPNDTIASYDSDFTKIISSIKKTNINFEGYTLLNVDGGDLSGTRQAEAVVDIGYGDRHYYAFTNEYGQLVKVTAKKIVLQDAKSEKLTSEGRYYEDEAKVPGTESEAYDEGHVIADSLGGVANAYNITPQDSTLNRFGDQAYMEKVIRDAGGCTDFVAIITYPDTKTQIPSHYRYTYTLLGNQVVDDFDNVNPEKVNEVVEVKEPVITVDSGNDISGIDTNGNGKVTIAEAKAAGYKMPIYNDHWLYKYMDDRDKDGMVGE